MISCFLSFAYAIIPLISYNQYTKKLLCQDGSSIRHGGDTIFKICIENILGPAKNLKLDISDSSITAVICPDDKFCKALLSILGGTDSFYGDIWIDQTSLKHSLKNYKKRIDIVSQKKIDSTLSIDEYVNFYAMIQNRYDDFFLQRKLSLFHKLNLDNAILIKMNHLTLKQQQIIRFLAGLMKDPSVIICQGLFDGMSPATCRTLITLLKEYTSSDRICLLLTCDPSSIFELSDEIDIFYPSLPESSGQ